MNEYKVTDEHFPNVFKSINVVYKNIEHNFYKNNVQ